MAVSQYEELLYKLTPRQSKDADFSLFIQPSSITRLFTRISAWVPKDKPVTFIDVGSAFGSVLLQAKNELLPGRNGYARGFEINGDVVKRFEQETKNYKDTLAKNIEVVHADATKVSLLRPSDGKDSVILYEFNTSKAVLEHILDTLTLDNWDERQDPASVLQDKYLDYTLKGRKAVFMVISDHKKKMKEFATDFVKMGEVEMHFGDGQSKDFFIYRRQDRTMPPLYSAQPKKDLGSFVYWP